MTEYVVGLRHGKRSEVLTIEAEDALIAALKAKHNHPEALISYVRKSNRRGDRRNPHRNYAQRPCPLMALSGHSTCTEQMSAFVGRKADIVSVRRLVRFPGV